MMAFSLCALRRPLLSAWALAAATCFASSVALAQLQPPPRGLPPAPLAAPLQKPAPMAVPPHVAAQPTLNTGFNEPTWPLRFEMLGQQRHTVAFSVGQPGAIEVTVEQREPRNFWLQVELHGPNGLVAKQVGAVEIRVSGQASAADVARGALWRIVIAPTDPNVRDQRLFGWIRVKAPTTDTRRAQAEWAQASGAASAQAPAPMRQLPGLTERPMPQVVTRTAPGVAPLPSTGAAPPAQPSALPPTLTGLAPLTGGAELPLKLTGTNLTKLGARALWEWFPNNDETQPRAGAVETSVSNATDTEATVFSPQPGGPIPSGTTLRLTVSGNGTLPIGRAFAPAAMPMVAGRYRIVDNHPRIDRIMVRQAATYAEQDWASPGDRVDIIGVNLGLFRSVRLGAQGEFMANAGISSTLVQFTLPPCTGTGRIKLIDTQPNPSPSYSAGLVLESARPFTCYVPPVAQTVSPASVPWGGQVNIAGRGLDQVRRIVGPGGASGDTTGAPCTGQGCANSLVARCTATMCIVTLPFVPFQTPVTHHFTLVTDRGEVTTTPVTVLPVPFVTQLQPKYGPAGTYVRVGGQLFTGTGLRINGQPMPASASPDGTSFSFAVPAGATSGPVQVGSGEVRYDFVVGQPGAPAITDVQPRQVRVGHLVTINGQELVGVDEVVFPGGGIERLNQRSSIVHRQNIVQIAVPAGAAGSGPLIVRGPFGQATSAFAVTVTP